MRKRFEWTLSSSKDPRWKSEGVDYDLKTMERIPPSCERAIKDMKSKYGNPPSDLKWVIKPL